MDFNVIKCAHSLVVHNGLQELSPKPLKGSLMVTWRRLTLWGWLRTDWCDGQDQQKAITA